jgi:predicted nuclease with TOPRIM domain
LQKQLGEQRKALASKEKEGSKLAKELEKERSAVEQCRAAAAGLGYDSAAAAGLEEEAEQQRGEVQRWRDRVDELGSQLAGASGCAVGGAGTQMQGGRGCLSSRW